MTDAANDRTRRHALDTRSTEARFTLSPTKCRLWRRWPRRCWGQRTYCPSQLSQQLFRWI